MSSASYSSSSQHPVISGDFVLLLLKPILLVLLCGTELSWLCHAGTSPSDGSHFKLLPVPGRASPSLQAWGGLCPAHGEVAWPLRGLGPRTVSPGSLRVIVVSVVFHFRGSEIIRGLCHSLPPVVPSHSNGSKGVFSMPCSAAKVLRRAFEGRAARKQHWRTIRLEIAQLIVGCLQQAPEANFLSISWVKLGPLGC